MKLLELTRAYYPSIGGHEKFVHDRTKIFDSLEIDYSIVTTDFSAEKYERHKEDRKVSVVQQFTPYNIAPSLLFHLKDDIDVVSITLLGRFYGDYAIHHYAKTKTKIIVTPLLSYHTDKYSFIKKIFEKHLFPYLLNRIDALIVFTEYEKNFWIKHYSLNPRKIFVIPPYIENYVIGNIGNISQNRIPDPYLMYLGRAGENKKTDLLLKAFINSPQLKHHLYLTIRIEDVDNIIRKHVQNDERVHLLGYINEDEKNGYIKYTDGVVFPTSLESFGYAAFEASMWNKPLLCSNIPVFRELLNPQGVLWFENTVEDAAKVLNVFENMTMQERETMGISNKNNLSKFSFDNAVLKYQNMFKHILTSAEYR